MRPASTLSRALFLDRDGVININHGYVHRVENFDFVDGIMDLARQAYTSGYRLVVITNQAGIGRGLYTEAQFHLLMDWMCARFQEAGAPIAKVYFSPYHPTEGQGIYKREHFSRKPMPGMILQARNELQIDLAGSVLIGDKPSDIQAGLAAGVALNLLFAASPAPELSGQPYEVCASLAAAAERLRTFDEAVSS